MLLTDICSVLAKDYVGYEVVNTIKQNTYLIESTIMPSNKPVKVEVIKSHKEKLFNSLPVHKDALNNNLFVPEIYSLYFDNGQVTKVSEWVQGNTIKKEMELYPGKMPMIMDSLAKYMVDCFNVKGITPVDNHFENFVWVEGEGVCYIDLKKLQYRTDHIDQIVKITLKGCRGDRKKAETFLRSYAKYGNLKPILKLCEKYNWKHKCTDGTVFDIGRVLI